MSGSIETELPSDFRRREKLRLTLHRTINEPSELKDRVRSISCDELARKIRLSFKNKNKNKHTMNKSQSGTGSGCGGGTGRTVPGSYLLLDCRGFLCFSESHIQSAVHIACADRFNRKRVQNSGSVLDLVSTSNWNWNSNSNLRSSKGGSGGGGYGIGLNHTGKWRDVIVYDEGTGDLNMLENGWQSPISFVLMHLLQENRQPIYLKGGFKEFTRLYPELCDTSTSRKDLSILPKSPTIMSATHPHLIFPGPLSISIMHPLSPFSTSNPNTNTNSTSTTTTPTPTHCHGMERFENEPPTQVLPFLYVGNARDSNNRKLLNELGIRYILSVTTNSPSTMTMTTPFNSNSSNSLSISSSISNSISNGGASSTDESFVEFHTKWIPVSDNLSENLAPYFEDACDFIEEARASGTKILIHCQAGISRSPTIAIAYIMKQLNLSTLEAYAFVQRTRRIISPNLNFMGQLVEFETKLKGSSSTESSCSSIHSINSEEMIISD